MFVKLVAVGVLLFVLTKGGDVAKKQVEFFSNLANKGVVQQEVDAVSRKIYVEYIVGEEGLPLESDEWWTNYLSKTSSRAQGREPGKDIWGTAYRVRIVDRLPGSGQPGYIVRSAGPDKEYDTDDDIISVGKYEAP